MSERWKPMKGETYCIVGRDATIHKFKWSSDGYDSDHYDIGNCFKTEKEAQAAAEKVKALLLSLHEPMVAECNQLPKLTAKVFDCPECPENAKIAVVNQDGSACFGGFTKVEPVCGFWRGEGDGFWTILPGKWDASEWENSLIKRPVKETALPEQYKVGEWVAYYEKSEYKYFKIAKIELNRLYSEDGKFSLMCDVAKAKPRPYNDAEMRGLVGKVVDRKDGDSFLVTAYTPKLDSRNLSAVAIDDMWVMADDVLEHYTIAGKPAGVLEHLNEKGEWVK